MVGGGVDDLCFSLSLLIFQVDYPLYAKLPVC